MYCVKCGVQLADTEKICPLCATVVFHPDVTQAPAEPLYPKNQLPEEKGHSLIVHIILAAIFLLPIIVGWMVPVQGISIGGTSVIIVVGVAIETVNAIEAQMLMRHYKGFLE